MDLGLKGRTAIVTGSSKGIGRAIAVSLAREGVNVVMCARGAESLCATRDEILRLGGSAVALALDVTQSVSARRIVDVSVEQFGGLDILVNNVGGADRFAGFLELTDQDWRDAFELNVMSVVHLVRESLPWLQKSRAARIINISSISGIQPGAYNPHYTTVKAAVINLSKYLASQFARDKILVNVVCPGPVHSHSWERNVERTANVRGIPVPQARAEVDSEEAEKIPLGWVADGDDVAGIVTFLTSDKAAWITGSCFHVNGGKLRSMF